MAVEESNTADAQLASDVADKSLEKPTQTAEAAESLANGAPEDEGEEEEEGEEDDEEQATTAGVEAATSSKKKKKRTKKKKKKAFLEDGAATEELVSQQSSAPTKTVAAHDIQSILNQLALSQSGKETKPQSDYKFWNTQPVPKFKEPNLLQTTSSSDGESLPEGPILPAKVCRASAKSEPESLIGGYEWCLVDLDDQEELQELHDLLENHYVEDTDGSFRFKYSTQFLSWALKPPGWKKEWHIGIRAPTQEGKKGRLAAFIAGIPVTLKTFDQTFQASEINFLTIHRKLRGKRLAPILIKEVTRRCYLTDIYQALYTAGTLLPTPITTCRYFHRSLDWEHLHKTGFSHLPPNTTELRQKYKYRLESTTSMKGLRPMKKEDVPAVKDLLVRYLDRFSLRQEWTTDEVEHWLCSDASKGVVWSYVVEGEAGKITDFVSYYLLESTVLRPSSRVPTTIRAAYLYYYATESAFPASKTEKPTDTQAILSARLETLIHDALILAKKEDFHVFNALTLLDNPLFLKEQKFEPGDGKLHYYLFNWRTRELGGGINAGNAIDKTKMGGVGVVML